MGKTIEEVFSEAENHTEVLTYMRFHHVRIHVDSGLVQLIDPSGELDIVCTKWYAEMWCKTHSDWSWIDNS